MKRLLLLLFILTHLTPFAPAQDRAYDDLLVLYVDEEYVKCIAKAERYTEKESTRRDALPYLYMSMCFHEMGGMDRYARENEFRNAARDALKYAVKFRRKDKANAHVHKYADYWEELNTKAMEMGFNHVDAGEISKARQVFARMVGYQPENPGAWHMLALVQDMQRLQRDAAESQQRYHDLMASMELHSLSRDQKILLRESMMRRARHLMEAGRFSEARKVMAQGRELFMDNPEFRMVAEQVG
ncbi:MAG: hypothetical protein R2817_00985 [Flavobacteriales bacterium]